MKLRNVIFPLAEDAADADTGPGGPGPASNKMWDVDLIDGAIHSIVPASKEGEDDSSSEQAGDDNIASRLLLPPLCHPHIHLDKAYLLTGNGGGGGCACGSAGRDPQASYADLLPRTGSFAEALRTTAVAKARFTPADLRRRGAQLLATSYRQGVTAARVFVEVDAGGQQPEPHQHQHQTLHPSLAVALELRAAFHGRIAVQVCAFAQEVLFTGAAGTANRQAMEAALAHPAVTTTTTTGAVAVLGTAPYVEATHALALQNLDWAVATARAHSLHLDVHLDYSLDPVGGEGEEGQEPLIYALLDALVRHDWPRDGEDEGDQSCRRTVVVGHATRLTRLSSAALHRLAARIRAQRLPVYFVGLPTSDMYMMGKVGDDDDDNTDGRKAAAEDDAPLFCPRGTLPVPRLVRRFGLRACLGVNNVGNAFTPHGTGDPLQLACWGVGLFHAGTGPDAQILYGSVSWAARAAIGIDDDKNGPPRWLTDPAARCASARIGPVLVVANERHIQLLPHQPATKENDALVTLGPVPARQRSSVRDVVWDPPDVALRQVI